MKPNKTAPPIFIINFLTSFRRLISLFTIVCAPVPGLYKLAMPIKFSIVSFFACSGVMSADIIFLRKYWEKKYGYVIKKYGMPVDDELSEYGRLMLIEYPKLLDQLFLAFNAKAHGEAVHRSINCEY